MKNNREFFKILLVIKSVRWESKRQRGKVLKRVKQWRKENSYQVVDYTELKKKYTEPIEIYPEKIYVCYRNEFIMKNGDHYESEVFTPEPNNYLGKFFYYTEDSFKSLDDWWLYIDDEELKYVFREATKAECDTFNQKKLKIDALNVENDRYYSLIDQNKDIIDNIIKA